MLISCSEEYFYKSLLSGKFYRFLQTGRRDVDLSCVLHNIHCMPDEEIIKCSISIVLYTKSWNIFISSPMSSMFSSECEVLETANCLVSITTGQPSASPLTRRARPSSNSDISASVHSSPGSTVLTQPSLSHVFSTPGQITQCLSGLRTQYTDTDLPHYR